MSSTGHYVGYEQLADEEFLRAYEEATVIKNTVLAAAKALRAEMKSELAVSSRIPSPSNAHVIGTSSSATGKIRLVFQTRTTPGSTRGEGKAEELATAAPTAVADAAGARTATAR